MDKSAIEAISQAVNLKDLNADLLSTENPVAVIPDNFSIHALEKHQAFRNRFRGSFVTPLVSSFREYLTLHSGDSRLLVFINSDQVCAECYLDIGTTEKPGHGDHFAQLELQKTVAYTALLQNQDRLLSQLDAAHWLEDWRENITAIDEDGEEIEAKKLIATVRNISFKDSVESESTSEDFAAKRSSIESVEAKSKAGALPHRIYFTCKPYEDLEEMQFTLRLKIRRGGGVNSDGLIFSRVNQPLDEENIADGFKSLLEKELETLDYTSLIGIINLNKR
jgi:uncharacterized protein YfdQ (DUF2303 family)